MSEKPMIIKQRDDDAFYRDAYSQQKPENPFDDFVPRKEPDTPPAATD